MKISIPQSSCIPLLLVSLFSLTGCPKNEKPETSRVGVSTKPNDGSPTTIVPSGVAFNGERAMDHVRKQMDIGPRIPGSPELAKMREYITTELKKYGLQVTTDPFSASTPQGEKQMVNVTAELPG